MMTRVGDWYCYSGAVHIHTTESDGTLPHEEVVALGREVGLDFMMFADHMTLSNRDSGKEGYYGDTLVVIGYEHNDQVDNHHYLLYGSSQVFPSDMSAREYVAAGHADGGLGIIAHPDEVRKEMKQFRSYPWLDWSVQGYQGVELWNQMSEWMEQLTPYNKLAMAFSPRKSMVGPTDRILKKWDDLNTNRRVAGVASVDAHAFPVRVWPITVEIFPYKVHFKSLRTHIILDEPLSSDFDTARDQLYAAIRDCRLFCSNYRWGDAARFAFYAENSSGRAPSGGDIEWTSDTRLIAKLPEAAVLKLVGNGRYEREVTAAELVFDVPHPGVYRIEAWKKQRGWIFSNHIRIGVPDRSRQS